MAFTKELLQKHGQFRWKIEKLVCDGAEINYTEQYWIQEQWNKIKFSNEMPVVLEFTWVCVAKTREKVEHTMLRTAWKS